MKYKNVKKKYQYTPTRIDSLLLDCNYYHIHASIACSCNLFILYVGIFFNSIFNRYLALHELERHVQQTHDTYALHFQRIQYVYTVDKT